MNALENDIKLPRSQMRKHSVLLVDTGQPALDQVESQLAQIPDFRTTIATVDQVVKDPSRFQPDIVVLDIGSVGTAELEILGEIGGNYGDVPVVVVSEALDDAQVRKLLKQKVHDWLRKPLVYNDLMGTLRAAIRSSRQSSNRVHAVISAAGGAGATTVSVCLADILARKLAKTEGKVGLFDLDFSTGSCGYYLNMASNFNLDSVITMPSRIDAEFVNLIWQKHDNGFFVYSFKRREVVTHLNSYELVLRLLDVVTMQHSHTILDIPYYETDWRQDVLSGVNTVTILAELNLPSIRQALDILKSIKTLPGGPRPVQVLLNKRVRGLFGGQRIKASRLKELFGDTPFDYLPRDEEVLEEAMDRGILPSSVDSSARILRALSKFADKYLMAETAAAP